MTERPILFSAPMVRAILAGTKAQTRRVIKRPLRCPEWTAYRYFGPSKNDPTCRSMAIECGPDYPDDASDQVLCPYGGAGDRLWVRETFAKIDGQTQPWIETDYRATYEHGDRLGDALGLKKRWTPAIHMPRAASRLTLEITGVRVERLQDISEADAIAEGVGNVIVSDGGESRWMNYADPGSKANAFGDARRSYRSLWDSINGPGSWNANPWVWIVEFSRVT